jgi:hypothetical protein
VLTVKRRVRPMLGFKLLASARAILDGIEMVHMMRKGQAKYARGSQLFLAEQFSILIARGLRVEYSSLCPYLGSGLITADPDAG